MATNAPNERAMPDAMKGKAGKLSPNLAWVFALGGAAIAIGSTFVTAKMSSAVTWGVFFAIFGAAGFCTTFLTSAKTGIGVLAMAVAALATTGFYYWQVSRVAAAVGAVAGGFGGSGKAVEAASSMTLGVLLVPLAITLIDLLVGGIGGALMGAKIRAKAQG
jgi:hypothetical protein